MLSHCTTRNQGSNRCSASLAAEDKLKQKWSMILYGLLNYLLESAWQPVRGDLFSRFLLPNLSSTFSGYNRRLYYWLLFSHSTIIILTMCYYSITELWPYTFDTVSGLCSVFPLPSTFYVYFIFHSFAIGYFFFLDRYLCFILLFVTITVTLISGIMLYFTWDIFTCTFISFSISTFPFIYYLFTITVTLFLTITVTFCLRAYFYLLPYFWPLPLPLFTITVTFYRAYCFFYPLNIDFITICWLVVRLSIS